jgi:hypothetical protein
LRGVERKYGWLYLELWNSVIYTCELETFFFYFLNITRATTVASPSQNCPRGGAFNASSSMVESCRCASQWSHSTVVPTTGAH